VSKRLPAHYRSGRSRDRLPAGSRNERSPGPCEPRLLVGGNPTLRVWHFPLDETASDNPPVNPKPLELGETSCPSGVGGGLPACTSIRNRVATIQSKCVRYASMKKPQRKAGAVIISGSNIQYAPATDAGFVSWLACQNCALAHRQTGIVPRAARVVLMIDRCPSQPWIAWVLWPLLTRA
jgi:hypothetical protein